ncbi:MFS transporter [Streptomyces sp. M10(2022)]
MLLLLALVGAGTACSALGAPARRTFPVRLLPGDQVAAGLALTNISFQAAMLAGPAMAGLIIARWDFSAAYATQAVAIAVSMLAVIRLPAMKPEGTAAAGCRRRPERGGRRIILRRPTLWGSMATDLSATLLAMPIALFPLVNEVRFEGNPRTLGLFLSAVAVGDHGRPALRHGHTLAPKRSGPADRSQCVGPGAGMFRPGRAAVAGARLPGSGRRRRHGLCGHPQRSGPAGDPGRVPGSGLLRGTRHRRRGPRARQLPWWPLGVGHLRLLLAGRRRTVRNPGDRRRGRGQLPLRAYRTPPVARNRPPRGN